MASYEKDGEGGRTMINDFLKTPLGAAFVFLAFMGGGLWIAKKFS